MARPAIRWVLLALVCVVALARAGPAYALVLKGELQGDTKKFVQWNNITGLPVGAAIIDGQPVRSVHLVGEVSDRYTIVPHSANPGWLRVQSTDDEPHRKRIVDILVTPQNDETEFKLLVVEATGKADTIHLKLVVKEWTEFQKLEKAGASRPFWVNVGPWFPLAVQSGDSVPRVLTALFGVQGNAGLGIKKTPLGDYRFEISAFGRYSIVPMITQPDDTWTMRFLDVGGQGSVLLPLRTVSWTFLFNLGWVYRTSMTGAVPYEFSYRDVMGPRAGLTARADINLHHQLRFSGYYGMIGAGGFGFANLDNREFGGAAEWVWLLPYGHRITTKLDASYLQLSLDGQVLSTFVSGLSIGYGL